MLPKEHIGLLCAAGLALVVLGAACGAKQASPPPADTAGHVASAQAAAVLEKAR